VSRPHPWPPSRLCRQRAQAQCKWAAVIARKAGGKTVDKLVQPSAQLKLALRAVLCKGLPLAEDFEALGQAGASSRAASGAGGALKPADQCVRHPARAGRGGHRRRRVAEGSRPLTARQASPAGSSTVAARRVAVALGGRFAEPHAAGAGEHRQRRRCAEVVCAQFFRPRRQRTSSDQARQLLASQQGVLMLDARTYLGRSVVFFYKGHDLNVEGAGVSDQLQRTGSAQRRPGFPNYVALIPTQSGHWLIYGSRAACRSALDRGRRMRPGAASDPRRQAPRDSSTGARAGARRR